MRRKQLSVLTLGDPRLRLAAQPVENIDDRLQQLINNLLWTAEKANGVGIAAPQVGESLQLFIVASYPNLRYPHAPRMQPTPMINPRIMAHSDEQVIGWEGCLSVPDQRGQVDRWREIEVEYRDLHGHLKRQVFTDFVARIFQHELDHLQGTVFVDHVDDPVTLLTDAEYFAQLDSMPVIAGPSEQA
ncbi:MAG: peptide deformylase [Leptolyngbya sp. SIOISBB]|nr:peptide deformylase [Leptolyngbya sp. SIOISBB]